MILRILITLASASVLVANSFAQQVCNGYAEFCNRSYGVSQFLALSSEPHISNIHNRISRLLGPMTRLLYLVLALLRRISIMM